MPNKKEEKKIADERAFLEAIEAMSEPDQTIGKRLHDIIKASAPDLMPRTWYGMPAYSDGNKIICFFRGRQKFGERYMTLGFNDSAKLDEGHMWPIYYALTELTSADETKIKQLVKKAAN